MSLRPLPELSAPRARDNMRFDPPCDAMERWSPEMRALSTDASIDIFEPIDSEAYWGFTSRRAAAALREIGDQPVTVNINSPGGDYFEGVAIYEMLRAHPARVTVQIAGMAASIASVIAMAGDEVRIARTSSIMIHNAWTIVLGNRHDLQAAADWLAPFDAAIAAVYADRADLDAARAAEMMDAETWIFGDQAIELGFADAILNGDAVAEDVVSADTRAERTLEHALMRTHPSMSRRERRSLIASIKGAPAPAVDTPRAVDPVTPRADDFRAATERLLAAMAG